jgi:hypothetical protein
LRESFREAGRVKKRTLANLSAWPAQLVEGFRTLLKGGVAVAPDGIRIRRALPHGDAAAVLGTIRVIGLDRLLGEPSDKRLAPLAIALITSRLVSPASKLATARGLPPPPPPQAWAGCSGWTRSMKLSSTARSTGSARARVRSRPRSLAATSPTGRSCPTTSLRPGSKAGAASWRALVTA